MEVWLDGREPGESAVTLSEPPPQITQHSLV